MISDIVFFFQFRNLRSDINGDALHSSIGLPPALNVATAKVGKLEIMVCQFVALTIVSCCCVVVPQKWAKNVVAFRAQLNNLQCSNYLIH